MRLADYTKDDCARRLTRILAPRTGDMAKELELEIAEYLSLPVHDVRARLTDATETFTEEWKQRVPDPADERAVTRFYNESKTELFDLAKWHATDPIHCRSLMCADIARQHGGSRYLDYGAGIGSDALVFADEGFEVTLADVSEPLLAFARWRCERRGIAVTTIDLKRETPPRQAFDVTICFDVLEHVHRPLKTLDAIRRSLVQGGLLFVHAPFGEDPDRPMHVVHSDVITPRMRSVGFNYRDDLDAAFPEWIWPPRVYQAFDVTAIDRFGYRVYDSWFGRRLGEPLARAYRLLRPNHYAA